MLNPLAPVANLGTQAQPASGSASGPALEGVFANELFLAINSSQTNTSNGGGQPSSPAGFAANAVPASPEATQSPKDNAARSLVAVIPVEALSPTPEASVLTQIPANQADVVMPVAAEPLVAAADSGTKAEIKLGRELPPPAQNAKVAGLSSGESDEENNLRTEEQTGDVERKAEAVSQETLPVQAEVFLAMADVPKAQIQEKLQESLVADQDSPLMEVNPQAAQARQESPASPRGEVASSQAEGKPQTSSPKVDVPLPPSFVDAPSLEEEAVLSQAPMKNPLAEGEVENDSGIDQVGPSAKQNDKGPEKSIVSSAAPAKTPDILAKPARSEAQPVVQAASQQTQAAEALQPRDSVTRTRDARPSPASPTSQKIDGADNVSVATAKAELEKLMSAQPAPTKDAPKVTITVEQKQVGAVGDQALEASKAEKAQEVEPKAKTVEQAQPRREEELPAAKAAEVVASSEKPKSQDGEPKRDHREAPTPPKEPVPEGRAVISATQGKEQKPEQEPRAGWRLMSGEAVASARPTAKATVETDSVFGRQAPSFGPRVKEKDASHEAFGARLDFAQNLEIAQKAQEGLKSAQSQFAAAQSAAQDSPLFDKADVLNQLSKGVNISLSKDGTEVQMQLKPESLGKVDIHIIRTGEGLTAKITVENEKVLEMFDSLAQKLNDTLSQKGLTLASVEFAVKDQRQESRNSDRERGRNRRGSLRRETPAIMEATMGRDVENVRSLDLKA